MKDFSGSNVLLPMGQAKRLDALTSLRWFAAFAVLLRHMASRGGLLTDSIDDRLFAQGVVGVSFFFVLSGFVLTWSHKDNDTAPAFLQRRFARIYPAYVVAAFLMIALYLSQHARIRWQEIFTFSLLQSFSWKTNFALNSVSWSLSCEMFFYVAFPFVLPLIVRMPLRNRRVLMGVCALVPFVVAGVLQPVEGFGKAFWFMYTFPPVRMVEFIIGILLALEVRERTWPKIQVLPAIAIALAGYVAAGFVPRYFMYSAIAVVPFTVLIGAVAQSDVDKPVAFFHWRPLIWLGEVSYAFYLVHLIVLDHLRINWDSPVPQLLTLPLALALAAAIHHFVEKPMDKLLRPKPRPSASSLVQSPSS